MRHTKTFPLRIKAIDYGRMSALKGWTPEYSFSLNVTTHCCSFIHGHAQPNISSCGEDACMSRIGQITFLMLQRTTF